MSQLLSPNDQREAIDSKDRIQTCTRAGEFKIESCTVAPLDRADVSIELLLCGEASSLIVVKKIHSEMSLGSFGLSGTKSLLLKRVSLPRMLYLKSRCCLNRDSLVETF